LKPFYREIIYAHVAEITITNGLFFRPFFGGPAAATFAP